MLLLEPQKRVQQRIVVVQITDRQVLLLPPGKSKRQIADATLDDYNNNEQEINRYSEGRISANRSWTNTYDENDGEYLKMQAEMNDWMPQDTAAMYENLLKQLSRNRKKVWGRDIFNNKSLSFEPKHEYGAASQLPYWPR